MKKHFGVLALATFLGGLGSFWIFTQAQAQIDSFTFFIPYPADILDNQFDVGNMAYNLVDDDIETVISIAVHRDGTQIHYDHWEDGLEPILSAAPTQSSTEVWGDNNLANGIPPGFATDALNAGDVIILRNIVPLPRDPANFFFDGGDTFTAVGGAVATAVAVWPIHTPAPPSIGILYAGAWELYPTNRWGLEYRIPVGEDLAGVRPAFTVVGLNVQAVGDNTTVQLDLDANNTFETTVTLNKGEQFTQVDGVRVGARIQATAPIQVHIFAANPASNYEGRAYTMVSFDQWSDDILGPRGSDGDFWLYNPHNSTLDIVVQTITATIPIAIPANSTVKYPPAGLSTATGIRATSIDGRPFNGVVALDASLDQDWGYALQPINRLSTQTLVGLGIGNNNTPPDGDESRLYITAVTSTIVFADYENDGITDASFPISPLQEVSLSDPDHNLTGAYLFTDDGTPFLSVWGQDESAPIALPSIDIGTNIVPMPSLLVQKTVGPIIQDIDCSGNISFGDTIQYHLEYFNNTIDPVANITIEDNLPPEVTYVPNSTIVISGPSLGLIPDGGATLFPLDEGGYLIGDLPLLESGSMTFDVTITSQANFIVNLAETRSSDLPVGSDSVVVFTPVNTVLDPVYELDKQLIDPSNNLVMSGDMITFSLTITNGGNTTFTKFPLQDTFDENHLTFLNAAPPPNSTAPGMITWNDLTAITGPIAPGQMINLILTYAVDQIPDTITSTTTIVTGTGGEYSDGTPLPTCSDEATINFVAPPPSPTPTTTPPSSSTPPEPPPSDDDDDSDDPTPPTPTPPASLTPPGPLTPNASPTGTPAPAASILTPTTTVFPVVLLPATGEREPPSPAFAVWLLVALAVLGPLSIWLVSRLDKEM